MSSGINQMVVSFLSKSLANKDKYTLNMKVRLLRE